MAGLEWRALAEAPALIRWLRRLGQGLGEEAQAEVALLEVACLEVYATTRGATGTTAARRLLRQALARCRGTAHGEAALMTPASLTARCLDGLGELELAAGRAAAALRLHRQALDVAGAAGDWGAEIHARVAIGQTHLGCRRLAEAFVEARAALTKSNAVGDRVGQVRALRLLAGVSAAHGNYSEAERDAHLAVTFAAGARARGLEMRIWQDLAAYAEAQGLADDAAEARQEAERLHRNLAGGSALASGERVRSG